MFDYLVQGMRVGQFHTLADAVAMAHTEIDPSLVLIRRAYDRMECEHGLSADLCYGPQHYWLDEYERQHYGW